MKTPIGMWKRGSLWKYIVSRVARAQGFPDPVDLFSRLGRFARPAEVWFPTELLRSGAVMQARGLMNTQVIQHNPDWVWPYWAECQFDPESASFIPRAFNLTHINLTHRNWTAVGLPGFAELPIVDPRGLLTPFFDGWSLDVWLWKSKDEWLIPSKCKDAEQSLKLTDVGLEVSTILKTEKMQLHLRSETSLESGSPVCRLTAKAQADAQTKLIFAVRPYNPEGVSFIHKLSLLDQGDGWKMDPKQEVLLEAKPAGYFFSNYISGDVLHQLSSSMNGGRDIRCEAGMASSAALYDMPDGKLQVTAKIPYKIDKKSAEPAVFPAWPDILSGTCRLEIPDRHYQFLYNTALSSLILHSPDDVYPGPFTYKRFWFRDAAFILYAMTAIGLEDRVEKVLDRFQGRQTPGGYFLSQNGEWDSNGQALWILGRFAALTNRPPKKSWRAPVLQGAAWIRKKRLSKDGSGHAGLLPTGFSAEHFGPNDHYYWDNFWAVAGLRSAAVLARSFGEAERARAMEETADDLMSCIEKSLDGVHKRIGTKAVPASPYRRMDAGAVGSLAASYPLQLWDARDPRLRDTADFILSHCLVLDGFYQEINHSGINAYLTLDIAQALLRMGDDRYLKLVKTIADLASPTGQWPEAIHPHTRGGCMGDGQHMWAAAEWVMMMRNFFAREEEKERTLVLCSGILPSWTAGKGRLFMGPINTSFGKVSVTVEGGEKSRVSWKADWYAPPARIELRLPGYTAVTCAPEAGSAELRKGDA